jgi:hypothetical protein
LKGSKNRVGSSFGKRNNSNQRGVRNSSEVRDGYLGYQIIDPLKNP